MSAFRKPQQQNLRQVFGGDPWTVPAIDPGRIEMINVNDIETPEYQRPLKQYKIRAMVRAWRPNDVGNVLLSLRSDGRLYVVDGQHRVEAIRHLQGKIGPYVPAIVKEGMTSSEEAEFFARTQAPENRTALSPDDLHKAAKLAGDVGAISFDRAVTAAGFHIGADGEAGRILAVKAARAVFDRYGPSTLTTSLVFIRQTWGNSLPPPHALIGGVGLFLAIYPGADLDAVSRRLKKESVDDWLRRAKGRAANERMSNVEGVAYYLHSDFNRSNPRKKLPDFVTALIDHRASIRSQASQERWRRSQ